MTLPRACGASSGTADCRSRPPASNSIAPRAASARRAPSRCVSPFFARVSSSGVTSSAGSARCARRWAMRSSATGAEMDAGHAAPQDAEALYLRALSLEEQGQLEQAAGMLARATAMRPDFADAHNDLGRLLLSLGRAEAAIASCRRALTLRPRFAAALGNLANAER